MLVLLRARVLPVEEETLKYELEKVRKSTVGKIGIGGIRVDS